MDFFYDASGYPFAVKYNGDLCYYITNLQGDVMSIVDAQGEVVAEYEYDPYGNILTATGPLADVNPLRYRGYVFDTESGLYYLQSRYYDPEMGRFINADALVSTGQGILGNNMFAYCGNNAINCIDSCGHDAVWIQEESNVGTMGHSGLLVEDEETGKWYYFFWGKGSGGAAAKYYYVEISVGDLDLSDPEDVKVAVGEALSKIEGETEKFIDTREKITDVIYFEGNYSATHEYILELGEKLERETAKYNLLVFNCGQASLYAISQSDKRFLLYLGIHIPNIAYCAIKNIHSICDKQITFNKPEASGS